MSILGIIGTVLGLPLALLILVGMASARSLNR